ncbi:Asp23/Gls24 family envelope stress response protein [Amycolatopsis sp. NPDC098790]|uniref:Asp23/Gls24 family envelope stress response protein n=1 Tax=Amycolatopsis sp. NPDC098790 TaxID=3363939 RepID=UPI003828AF73
MSDVINSIFGRAQNETPSSETYEYGTTATGTVDADTTGTETVEPAEDTAEVETEEDTTEGAVSEEDAAEETDEAAETSEPSESSESSESDEDTGEAVSEEAEVPAVAEEEEIETPVAVEEETSRPAAGTRGSTTVADGVVSKIVVRVARGAEGVHELDEAGTSVEVEGEVATIAVTLVVEFGRAVKTLAEQIRVQVIEAVEEYLGLEVASVDVHVADIHFPDAD